VIDNFANTFSKESFDRIVPLYRKHRKGEASEEETKDAIEAILTRDPKIRNAGYTAWYIVAIATAIEWNEAKLQPRGW